MDPLAPTSVRVVPQKDIQLEVAQTQIKHFKRVSPEDATEGEPGEIPDMMDLATLWEWAGVSLGKKETFLLFLSIKQLVASKQLKSVRLWGKIYGRDANYIIAEAEMKDGVQDAEDALVNPVPSAENAEEVKKSTETEESVAKTEAKLPQAKVKVMAPLSKEVRIGVNKYIYYVCHYGMQY